MYGSLNQKKLFFPYPFLETALQEKFFSDLDLFFARTICLEKEEKKQSEEELFFLSLLMASHRLGHLCLSEDPDPLLNALWQKNSTHVMEKEEFFAKALIFIKKGKEEFFKDRIPVPFLTKASDEKSPFSSSFLQPSVSKEAAAVVEYDGSTYLQKNWIYETKIVKNIERLAAITRKPLFDEKLFFSEIEKKLQQKCLNSSQGEAIIGAFLAKFALIYGGPGTGKTYVASHLISLFAKAFLFFQDRPFQVFVAAPTGKAVSHLLSKVNKMVPKATNLSLEAATLHALLKMRKGEKKGFSGQLIFADLVIIDEASMIDERLMAHILDSLSDRTYVVFMGDPAQLFPIDSGAPFVKMVHYLSEKSQKKRAFLLSQCMRTEDGVLHELAQNIQRGSFPYESGFESDSFTFRSLESFSFEEKMEKLAKRYECLFFQGEPPVIDLLQHRENFRILSSLNKGLFGVDRINRSIYSYLLQKHGYSKKLAVPIIIKQNHERLKLYNGEMGYVILSYGQEMKKAEAIFFDGTEQRRIPVSLLPSFDLGYCLSIHKSQGSEFADLCVVLPKGSLEFGRELLYTAVTRAKKSVEIIGDLSEIRQMVKKVSTRHCLLEKRLAL